MKFKKWGKSTYQNMLQVPADPALTIREPSPEANEEQHSCHDSEDKCSEEEEKGGSDTATATGKETIQKSKDNTKGEREKEHSAAKAKDFEQMKAKRRKLWRSMAPNAVTPHIPLYLLPKAKPLDPEVRAQLVEQAIADSEAREARHKQVEAALERFRLSGGRPRPLSDELRDVDAAALLNRRQPKRRRRKMRFESPPASDDYITDDDDLLADADCLDRQLAVMSRMQRKIAALERRLVARRDQLRDVTRKYQESVLVLDQRRGMDAQVDRRKMKPPPRQPLAAEAPPKKSPEPLMVLRSRTEPVLADLPPGDDMMTLPTDLPMALRVICRLRLEVMALRSRVLQRAFRETTLRCEMMSVNREHADAEVRWMDSLDAVFTPAQKARLRPDCRHVPWAEEDYLKTIALRWVCSRRTFDYVCHTMKIPLPSMYSVRAVAAFGRYPEVTRRYDELSQHKTLRFTRSLINPGSDSDNTEIAAPGASPQQAASQPSGHPPPPAPPLESYPPDGAVSMDGPEGDIRPMAYRGRRRGRGRGQGRGRSQPRASGGRGRKRKAASPRPASESSPVSKRACWTSGMTGVDGPTTPDDWGAPVQRRPAGWRRAGHSPATSDDSEPDSDSGDAFDPLEFSQGRQAWAPPARTSQGRQGDSRNGWPGSQAGM